MKCTKDRDGAVEATPTIIEREMTVILMRVEMGLNLTRRLRAGEMVRKLRRRRRCKQVMRSSPIIIRKWALKTQAFSRKSRTRLDSNLVRKAKILRLPRAPKTEALANQTQPRNEQARALRWTWLHQCQRNSSWSKNRLRSHISGTYQTELQSKDFWRAAAIWRMIWQNLTFTKAQKMVALWVCKKVALSHRLFEHMINTYDF